MAIGSAFLLRTQFRSHARLWTLNQHYADVAGQDDLTAAEDLVAAWIAAHKTGVLSEMAADTTFESVYSVKLTDGDAMPGLTVLDSEPGVVSGESLPPNSAVVVSLGSNDPGLIRPGRLYVAGIPKSGVLSGNLSAAYLATFKTDWDKVAGDTLSGAGGDWTPVILRTVQAGVPLVPPQTANVTSVRIKPILYSQRRRNSRQQGAAA